MLKFRGYFFVGEVVYSEKLAIEKLKIMINEHGFNETVKRLNGSFSIIFESETEFMFAVDVIRSLPLFYSIEDDIVSVSDSANTLYDKLNYVTFDQISVEEFKLTQRFVTGDNTLFSQIKQVQAGEIVSISKSNGQLKKIFYYDYSSRGIPLDNYDELKKGFDNILVNVSNKLIKLLKNRTAVIPLTGGTDSRELLYILNRVGYRNVICFTAGKKGNKEAKIAKQIAEYFKYKWYEVEYTKDKWKSYSKSEEIQTYRKFCSNLSSLPHFLDILAIKELSEKGLIPLDSVIIPGHTGVIIGGNLFENFLKDDLVSFSEMKQLIKMRHYKTNKLSNQLNERIDSYFEYKEFKSNFEMEAEVFSFEMRERQIKFICNSVRVYEFLGYEWLLPLCDKDIMEFMSNVSLNMKYHKKFVRQYMGIKSIESTSDETTYIKLSKFIRNIKPIRIVIRKLSKVIKYNSDILQTGGLYGFIEYLKTYLISNEYFDFNTLESKVYLESLKEKVNLSEKK